jgi:cytochrome c peroxidase
MRATQQHFRIFLLLTGILLLSVAALFCWQSYPTLQDQPQDGWSPQELALLQSFNLANLLATQQDPSNRFAQNPQAVKLGSQLFFDPRLSRNGKIACASCHQPDKAFSDGKTVAQALDTGTRNTPSLLGAAYQPWFFWDGRKDSLWSQALEPLENPAEHGLTRVEVIRLLLTDATYRQQYTGLFGALPDNHWLESLPTQGSPLGDLAQLTTWKQLPQAQREQIDQLFANTGKAIAAYVSTLKPQPNRFDTYLNALANKQPISHLLTPAEKAGARLFIGKGQCLLCHSGAMFSNQGFQNIGTGIIGKDSGRAAILDTLRADRFNCTGPYSDAQPGECRELEFMPRNRHAAAGTFKVPSLRNAAHTAPYFHDGRHATLEDVVDYYVQASATPQQDTDLPRIHLTDEERTCLTAFLKSL